jgi:hypothetical protein
MNRLRKVEWGVRPKIDLLIRKLLNGLNTSVISMPIGSGQDQWVLRFASKEGS